MNEADGHAVRRVITAASKSLGKFDVRCTLPDRNQQCMLLGGQRLSGERFLWWNFVSSSRKRIEQAKNDWRNGHFDAVPGDAEFIPLPGSIQ